MEESVRKKIPKVIHFIWFGKPMPWYIRNHIKLIKSIYKDFKIKIWTEKDFDPETVKYTRLALQNKKWAFISDYLRVKILYENGGVYLDTDMIPVGDMRPLLDEGSVVLGFEYSKMITTGFAASIPKHPFMKKVLETYETFEYVEDQFVHFIINNELWTYYLQNSFELKPNNEEQLLLSDIKVYPMRYFAEFKKKDGSIFLHDHKLSWTSPTKAKVMNWMLKHFVRPTQGMLSYVFELQKKMYFRKNKKIIKRNQKAKEKKQNEDDIIDSLTHGKTKNKTNKK